MSDLTYHHSMKKRDKPLVWLYGEVKSPPFSFEARIEAGVLLRRLQQCEAIGLPHSRPMPSIGRACHELRIQDENKTWRIVYCLAAEAVVILEVFAKTTNQTPQSVIDICKNRLRQYRTI
jgi:phage-related protein